ncbi:uncharacterized protein LOC132631594 isoform X2 [Lycium barbarum]|uniref:uncharacterized protein LOC132631594 isoform X2 n=1 Tax=Lycium barbarum TaxID=112863 RepID=UPI00293F3EC8|nr:uncharacterized protein LOC132631594 isoform X2 [Lycium barbarum]
MAIIDMSHVDLEAGADNGGSSLRCSSSCSSEEAFAMVMGDESQKSDVNVSLGTSSTASIDNFESIAMYTKGGGNQKYKKNYNLVCEVCKIKGYNKESCWKVIGYPPEYKFKKRGGGTSSAYNVFSENGSESGSQVQFRQPKMRPQVLGSQTNNGTMKSMDDPMMARSSGQGNNAGVQGGAIQIGNTFSNDQYEQILNLLNNSNSHNNINNDNSTANIVGRQGGELDPDPQ